MEAVSSPLQHFKFSGVRQQRFKNCSSSSRRGENTFFCNMVHVSYNADKKLRKVNKTSYNSFLSSYASTNMTGTVVKPTLEVSNMKRHCAQNAYGSTEACVLSDNIQNVSLNTAQEKVGVLLLNLGGPETLDDVQPFLFNLFADPDIIRLPRLLRFLQKPLAKLISTSRAPKSKKAYASIGGGSPLKKITEEQAIALKTVLEDKDVHANVCVAMRYWHPFTEEAIHKIKRDGITKLVILPLYPQFSISTSGSSICVLKKVFREDDYFKKVPISIIESWYRRKGYITSMANLIEKELSKFSKPEEVVIFFSAHGVPLSYVESAGDPYKDQMEDCVGLIIHELKSRGVMNNHILAYQSRVGPIQWLKPYTDEVIVELGKKGVRSLLAVPISFVSEHIETLEEIDMEYRQLAAESGIKNWGRVPTLGLTPSFISDLADAVIEAIPSAACISAAEMSPTGVAASGGGGRLRRITKLFFGLILAIIVSLFFAPRMLRAVRYKFN